VRETTWKIGSADDCQSEGFSQFPSDSYPVPENWFHQKVNNLIAGAGSEHESSQSGRGCVCVTGLPEKCGCGVWDPQWRSELFLRGIAERNLLGGSGSRWEPPAIFLPGARGEFCRQGDFRDGRFGGDDQNRDGEIGGGGGGLRGVGGVLADDTRLGTVCTRQVEGACCPREGGGRCISDRL